jgi:hypothetical protein
VVAGNSDADWTGNADDGKSTSRGCFYVGTNLVAWMSRKQSYISLSTVEAKYNAVGSCCTQLLLLVLLASFCVWTKSLVCKDAVLQGILLFRKISKDSVYKSKNLWFPVNRPDDRAIPSERPSVHCSICPDEMPYRPDARQTNHHPSGRRTFFVGPLLYREATVPACIRSDVSAARPDASQ